LPGLIQAMSSPTGHLPAIEFPGGNEHCEVSFTASTWERGGNIGLLFVRALNAEDQHVFGKPSFFPCHGTRDPERETFFSKKGVTAVTRSK
jgi:hypothetical protein